MRSVRGTVLGVLVAGELAALGFRVADFDDDPIGDLDDDTLALLAAMDELDAERAFDPAKHPRIPKGQPGAGQFLSTVARLKAKLKDHLDGGGDGDPFDGFNREQLRKAAKTRGIQLVRGESRESIAAKLLADLRKGHEKPSKPKPAKAPSPPRKPKAPAPEPPKSKYGTPGGKTVRESLANATTFQQINAAANAEAARLGARTQFNIYGSKQLAREHAEGILRGLERFPKADVRAVGMFDPSTGGGDLTSYAHAYSARGIIEFSEAFGDNEADYRKSLQRDAIISWHPTGTDHPIGVAIHEFGHVLDIRGLDEDIHTKAEAVWLRHRGPERKNEFGAPVSRYAATNTKELIAEAFADVMMNGDQADTPSKEIFDLLVDAYSTRYGAPT